jgi:cobalt-zinc-cadmium resistance protein CzcA
MFDAIIKLSVSYRRSVIVATCLLVGVGLDALRRLPIDAIPDLTNVQVQILTNANALGPLDIERLITQPVELALAGLPYLQEVRSLSRFGGSAVTAVFDDAVDPYFCRQMVAERLVRIRDAVPKAYGVPEMGPMSTGLGEIYQFEVRGTTQDAMALRAILDWDIAPRLRTVPGVVEVNTFGGKLKTYEVSIEPQRLVAANVTLEEIFVALENNNRGSGGGSIARGRQSLVIRANALVRSLDDISHIVVTERNGTPVTIGQLATVQFAPMLRQGGATRDGKGEIVAGMAMMLQGENSRVVARAVRQEVEALARTLPQGVTIEPFYDRTVLVDQTIETVLHNLLEGGALVIAVLFIMLRNVRAGLIAAAMIPLCMAVAFVGMRALGVSGNLMSLGAIDFGLVVDGGIIILENSLHRLGQKRIALRRPLLPAERDQEVVLSALEVRKTTAFGEAIIAIVYLPILALQGVEGKMFHPMATTVLLALAGAFVLSLTFVPACASAFLSLNVVDKPSPLLVFIERIYRPVLQRSLSSPIAILGGALVLLVISGICALHMGAEFTPRLDEGTLVVECNRLPSTSLEESLRQAGNIERVLLGFSEVKTVVSKTGRPEIANDLMGVEQSDVYVVLKPRQSWTTGRSVPQLVAQMSDKLASAIPGASFGFSQPIEMRMNELVSGVRSDLALKIYGNDFAVLSRLGTKAQEVLQEIPGAADIRVDRVQGLPVLVAQVDRLALGRLGASASDVLDAVETIGGRPVGTVYEGKQRYELRVRLAEAYRDDIDTIRRLPIQTKGHGLALLGNLAAIELNDEPVVINHEGGQRRLLVQVNVRDRDLASFATAAQASIAANIHLPPGYHIVWGGQFENLERAKSRLLIVVPLSLGLIFLLLYATFQAAFPAWLILLNIPFAATGGVLALWGSNQPFSISAAVGFIALFGVAVLNGLVLVAQMRTLSASGLVNAEAALQGALRRLRPVLTTALVASLGFLPMALAKGAGAEVQRPLATVVLGGLFTSTLLTLLVLPTAYVWMTRRENKAMSA